MNFGESYWRENYADLKSMDGIGNAKVHASYIKSFFTLDQIQIRSIADFGAGTGHLLQEVSKTLEAKRVYFIEPSKTVFQKTKDRLKKTCQSIEARLSSRPWDLSEWAQKRSQEVFDLGICTSVFQYLEEDDLRLATEALSQRVRYLYLTLPTDKELAYQREALLFHDRYALCRSREFYFSILKEHFTIVSSRFLESRCFFDETTTPLKEYFFRF